MTNAPERPSRFRLLVVVEEGRALLGLDVELHWIGEGRVRRGG